MQPSLSLQEALFRHQQRQIDALVAGASPAFKAYEARYRRFTRPVRAEISMEALHDRVGEADLVYVGDYHTLRFAQRSYLELVRRALEGNRRVVLALEFVEGRHQAVLDHFQAGRLKARSFLERIGHPYSGSFDIWPHFAPIFELAREASLSVVAIDRRASGARSLVVRDRFAARIIANAARAPDRPLIMVLMGQYHVAPPHLPSAVDDALGAVKRRSLIVLQNPEGAWWSLARAGRIDAVQAVELGPRTVGIFNASPVVSQRTFLDYCEAEAGDAPIEDGGLSATVKTLVREIGRLVGVPTGKALADLEIITPLELDALERLRRKGALSRDELAQLRRHVVSGESAYVPKARTVWLSGFSLNHAAEEAAHVVRHCAIGDRMHRDRPRRDAFWARCVEEAIGFFGSKLVNPKRTCPSLEEWKRHFTHATKGKQATAAFVLALSSVGSAKEAARLIPSGLDQFHEVSHALGYLLGEELYVAYRRGRLSRSALRSLFDDPLDSGMDAYDRWRRLTRRAR
jgi:uncharacterized iron-regulated protein